MTPARLSAFAIWLLSSSAAYATEPVSDRVPVPQARPALQQPAGEVDKPEEKPANWSTPEERAAATRDPALCMDELRKSGAKFKRLDPIREETVCGDLSPVALSAVGTVKLNRPATLTCEMALALSHWVFEVAVPMATLYLAADLAGLETGTSYQCRKQNSLGIGKYSEHAFANGLDVHGFLVDGKGSVTVQSRFENPDADALFQAAVRGGACAHFTTVLGPGTNDAHDNHFHFDLRARNGGYRLCE